MIRKLGNRKKEGDKKNKSKLGVLATKIGILALKKTVVKIVVISLIILTIGGFFTWLIELFTAKETPETIKEELEIEEVKELIEIKGNEVEGYHLEFVENIDERLDKLIEILARRGGNRTFPKKDKELIKKMIKAEVITEFPNLGGPIIEENGQFQGAVTVRRATPDKDLGELKSTGAGEKTTLDDLKEDNEEETTVSYEKGQELRTVKTSMVYLKGKYNFLGKKEADEGVTPKIKTMLSQMEGVDKSFYVRKGNKIYYTGETFFYENNTYLEVTEKMESKTVIGYIKRADVETPTNIEDNKEEDKKQDGNNVQPTKTIGDGNKKFVIAIAAGHNTTDDKGYSKDELVEEELTIEVAEKVEELFSEYSNIEVVQTGSTSENPGGVKEADRTKLARNANPDLCIQIYFNEGGETGVETCYEYGDEKSKILAEKLSAKIAENMDLQDRGTVTKKDNSDYYSIIDSSAECGFPSVITKGGFLDSRKDANVLKNGGAFQYARGIVEACEEYLVSIDHNNAITYVEKNDTYSRTRTRIRDLQYVSQEIFEQYVKDTDLKALETYTLDEEYRIITATWSMEGNTSADAILKLKKNPPMNFRTVLEKQTMPYEYLLFFLIDSENKKFVNDLADMVIEETEVILSVQDNITTTQVNTTTQQTTRILSDTGNKAGKYAKDWHTVNSESNFSEICSPSIAITYADTWLMTYSKGNTYSSKALGVEKGEKVDVIKNVRGKVNETLTRTDEGWNDNGSGGKVIETGRKTYRTIKPGATKEEEATGKNVVEHSYTYEICERKEIITQSIYNTYESGEAIVSGSNNKFEKLYKKHKMKNSVNVSWLTDIMAENERTSNLVDITKYMIYQATGVDSGVTDFDFSEFNLSAFANSSGGGIYGNTTQERIWWAILEAGYSKEAAAGVLGNIEAESGFKVDAIEGGYTADNGGIGLCQWTNYPRASGKGRNANLKAYASSKGKEWTDEMAQIEYLIFEITPGGSPDGLIKYALATYHGYSPDDWKNATTPEDAAIAFCWTFERPGVPRMDPRTQAARKYYEQFKDLEKPSGSGNILQTCEVVMKDMITRNVHYSLSNLTWANIEAATNHPYACCATYVSIVLYKSGLLTADQINAYNYNYTGSGGLPDMLAAAGWRQVSHDEIQPGDVINHYDEHVLIYAGGDMVYDQNCGVVSSSGRAPIGAPFNAWSRYKGRANVQVWRAP